MKREEKPAPSRNDKKLAAELAEQRVVNECLAKQLDEARGAHDELIDHARKMLHINHSQMQQKAELLETNRATAEGLMIERDELLVRARRIDMRLKGLGFNQ